MVNVRCVVIGGGTGSFSVLTALKGLVSDLSALVSMADDGGSTGALRDELGVLPPGDVRQCLVALSDAPAELRELFNYRFEEGSFAGHSFGNLFLSAVQKSTDDFGEAVRMAGDVLRISGRVIPITLDDIRLAISWSDGTTVRGEGRIDIMHFVKEKGLPELRLEPRGRINPEADAALRQADVIVVAPGDLYTSLGPLLIVDGVAEALTATKAKVIYVSNLVVKPGQTSGFTVADHAAEIERFAGSEFLDYVLFNTASPDPALFDRYTKTGETLVEPDQLTLDKAHYTAVGRPLVATETPGVSKGDKLAAHRSYIRHDPDALRRAIQELL